jgi:hypothetical protein
MATIIKDGASGNTAVVDNNNRLHTSSITQSAGFAANREGNAYNINSGEITLTNAADTPVLYVKNTGTLDLHVEAIAVGVGPTTGGTGGIPKVTIIRNPTAGTIISSPTDADIISNRNYGSNNSFPGLAYKGATGSTMTDGTDHIILYQTSSGRLFANIDEVLPTGSSIGIKFDPQASNTSQTIYAALICYLDDEAGVNP